MRGDRLCKTGEFLRKFRFSRACRRAFLLAAMVATLVACERTPNISPQATPSNVPDQEGWDSTVEVTSHGRPTAVIQYRHMQKYSPKNLVLFDGGIVVDFYNVEGKHTSNLVADKGKMYESTGKVEAMENVVVVSDSGITLMTNHLIWDPNVAKIFTEAFVTIATQEGDTLYGHGFESDQNLQNWTIKKPRGFSKKRLNLMELEAPPAQKDSGAVPPSSRQDSSATESRNGRRENDSSALW